MRRYAIILNPQSNRGRTARLAERIQHALKGVGEVLLRPTAHRGHAADLAHEAVVDGADVVVAVGGDGSVHETVNGLMRAPEAQRPPLAIVPAGSGNDFAFTLGLSANLSDVCEVLARNRSRRVDVGEIESNGSETRFWVVNVGTLLDGQINLASHQLRWPQGSGLYLRAALQTLCRKPPVADLTLVIDGKKQIERAIVLSMCNGPRSGGRFVLAPDATIDDGLGDYLSVAPVSRWRLLWLLMRSMQGAHLENASLRRSQFRKLSMHSSIPLAVHVDGEPWLTPDQGVHTLRAQILPAVLRVLW